MENQAELLGRLIGQHNLPVISDRPWYVIRKQPHHGIRSLHTQTAGHYLTDCVLPGDQIEAVIEVRIGSKGIWFNFEQHQDRLVGESWESVSWNAKIESVLGRSVMLGEDTADAAFGASAVELILEKLIEKKEWRLAPVAYTEDMPPEWKDTSDWEESYKNWQEKSTVKVALGEDWRCEIGEYTTKTYPSAELLLATEGIELREVANDWNPGETWVKGYKDGEAVRIFCRWKTQE